MMGGEGPMTWLKAVVIAVALGLLASAPASAQQTVRIAIATPGAPFSFHDDAANMDKGLMVDVINEVAKTAGLKLQPQSVVFASLIQTLLMGKADLIVGTLAITPTRKAQMAFSRTVYTDSDALIVPQADTASYATYDDLKGKVLGLQNGVVPLTSLHTDLYPKIRIYDGGPDVMRALVAGEIEVGVANRSISGYQLQIGAFPTLRLVPSFKPTTFGDVAFGIRKENAALVSTVDTALAKIEADGTLAAIFKKWGVQ